MRVAIMATLTITAASLGQAPQAPVKSPVTKSLPRAAPALGADIQNLIQRLTLRGAAKPKSEFETDPAI